MRENYDRFISSHGGRRPVVRNAYFTNGELYPWIEQSLDPTAVDNSSVYEIIPCKYSHYAFAISVPKFFSYKTACWFY